MNIPTFATLNTIDCSSIAERDALLNDPRYRVYGLSVTVSGVLYWLNADLSTWSPKANPVVGTAERYQNCAYNVYSSDESPLDANSGTHVLISIPIEVSTNVMIQIAWNCYDGSDTNRVVGSSCVNVVRGSGTASILSQDVGADYKDSTSGTSGQWSPTLALNGNALEVRLTADPYNKVIPSVSATVAKRKTTDAPTQAIGLARSALHATAPIIELYSDVGRTPSDATPGTVVTAWADQSGNGHNATVSGGVTYTPNASSKPALLYPASGGRVAPGAAIPASQSHTFSWRYKLGDAVGAAVEILLSSNTSPAAMFLTINWTTGATTGVIRYSNSDSTGYDVGTVPDAGTHDYTLVLDETAHTATLYIDGVAGTPITTAAGKNQWATPQIGGSYANAATYTLVSGNLHAFCYWGDAASPTVRDAAFRDLCLIAYGAHS